MNFNFILLSLGHFYSQSYITIGEIETENKLGALFHLQYKGDGQWRFEVLYSAALIEKIKERWYD